MTPQSEEAFQLDRLTKMDEGWVVAPSLSIIATDLPITSQQFGDLLDRVRSTFIEFNNDEQASEGRATLVITIGGVGISIGVAGWLLASRLLLAGVLSTAPLWRGVDPIPVLLTRKREEESPDDEQENDSHTPNSDKNHSSLKRASGE